MDGLDILTILAGMLDGATGLETRAEIFVADKGDYYVLQRPPLPQYEQYGHDVRLPDAHTR